MRIVHVILSRGFAGSERSTAESCNAQCAEHELLLVVRRSHTSRSGLSILEHVDARVRVAVVPDRWFTRRRIASELAAFAPDVIHTHLRRATRLVTQIRPRAATIATLHLNVNGPQFLELDGLICNAYWQQREIPASYPGLVFKLENSLTPHRRLAPDEIVALRRELGAGPGEFLVGGVGRLAYSKGWDTLILAFERAHPPNARLAILGEGRERRRLARLARRAGTRVLLAGFRRNVKDYYQALDLFVCPSRREPLPRVILEALDGGVPVVASTADGCRELLERYPGDLFPVEDVEALAALLARHAAEPVGRRTVDLSAHHVAAVNRSILAAYRAVIAQRATRAAPDTRTAGATTAGGG